MFNKWLGPDHYSEEDLLAWLDGELPARQMKRVHAHLQSCWKCRVLSENIAAAIARFVEARNATTAQFPPPGDWASFETRLRRAGEQPARKSKKLLRFPHWLPWAAVAASIVAATILSFRIEEHSEAGLSAAGILRRAGVAEMAVSEGTADPVVYQKVLITRKSGASIQTATLESWTDIGSKQQKRSGGEAIWKELETVLARNNLAGDSPLSAVAFHAWQDRAGNGREEIAASRLADGSDAFSIRTIPISTAGPDRIIEAGLVIRTRDWHAVEERLRIGGDREIRDFELAEVAYSVTPRRTVVSVLEDHPTLPALAAAPQGLRSLALPVADETEVLATLALHRAGACLGEAVETVRRNDTVVVRGMVETSDRKDALTAALESVPGLRIEIETVAEALDRVAAEAESGGAPEPATRSEQVRDGSAPIEAVLGNRYSPDQLAELANRVVSLSNRWLEHAWALRHLEQEWPAGKASRLPTASRWLLESAVHDHVAGIQKFTRSYRSALESVLPAKVPEVSMTGREDLAWPGEAGEILSCSQTVQQLTNALFTGADRSVTLAEPSLTQLAGCLTRVETRAARLEMGAAQLLEPNRSTGSADMRQLP